MSKSEMKFLDGAMGTMLLTHGVSASSCLELLNLTRPGLIEEIHRSYLQAGAQALVANTFGANRPRLSRHRLSGKLEAINRAGLRIARKVAGEQRAFASIGPLGPDAKRMDSAEMSRFFREQARALEKEKPAGYVVETMTTLAEAEAACLAVRESSDATLIVLLTRLPRARSWTREGAELIAATLRQAGADILGANCGVSPEDSLALVKSLSQVDDGPFAARPAAGLPGRLLSAEAFAAYAPKFRKLGCTWMGGCCGTTPAYLRALTSRSL